MTRADKAEKLFREKLNCAQSVLLAFASENGLDESMAMKIAIGFGAGMARLQDTCGAVTGAYMVLGIEKGRSGQDFKTIKEETFCLIRKFAEKFSEINHSTSCLELLDCDLDSDEGQLKFQNENLRDNVCVKCVRDSVRILEELLGKE